MCGRPFSFPAWPSPLAEKEKATSTSSSCARTRRANTRRSAATRARRHRDRGRGADRRLHPPGHGADHPLRLRAGADGEAALRHLDHEVQRPGPQHDLLGSRLPRGGGGVPGDRDLVDPGGRRGHGADPPPLELRRDRGLEPLRRHLLRDHGHRHRRPRPRPQREPRSHAPPSVDVRARARLRPGHRRPRHREPGRRPSCPRP